MIRLRRSKSGIQDRKQFDDILEEVKREQLELENDVATYNKEKAEADKAFKKAKKEREAAIDNKLSLAEAYADEHRDELFGSKKSLEHQAGLVGFRRSGSLKTLNSKWTFTKAKDALKEAGKVACIKITETLDKERTKKDIPEDDLPKYGLRMDYKDEFFFQPSRAEKTPDKRLKK